MSRSSVLPESLMSLSMSAGDRWKTIWPLILVTKSLGRSPAAEAALSERTEDTCETRRISQSGLTYAVGYGYFHQTDVSIKISWTDSIFSYLRFLLH